MVKSKIKSAKSVPGIEPTTGLGPPLMVEVDFNTINTNIITELVIFYIVYVMWKGLG